MKGLKGTNNSLNSRKISCLLKNLFFSLYCTYICFTLTSVVYADKLESSAFFKGTKQLLDDATKAIGILAPIVVINVVVYFFMRKSASDEMDYRKWDTRIKTALICGVGIETAAILINLFISYYK